MKKKVVGILICSLFVIGAFSSISFSQSIKNKEQTSNTYNSRLDDYEIQISGGKTFRTIDAEIIFMGKCPSALSLLQPTVEITSPDDGEEVTDQYITVEGYAYDESGLDSWEWFWEWTDGSKSGTKDIDPPAEYVDFQVDIGPLAPGKNTITVTFYNVMGEDSSDSVTIQYVTEDNDPPEVTITYPEEGMTFSYADITVLGYGSDNVGITAIGGKQEWDSGSFDTDVQKIDPPMKYINFKWNVTLHKGWNKLTVYMYDAATNKGHDTVLLTEVDCEKNKPKITDNSTKTKFYGLFVGCDYKGTDHPLGGAENAAKAMYEKLKGKPGWNKSRMVKLIGNDATRANIKSYLKKFKGEGKDEGNPLAPKPGDEFLFFFSGHGNNKTDDLDGDESDGYDESILTNDNKDITDDDLNGWISGFPKCVTITVKIDACHSGGFKDGTGDVQKAENADWDPYGENKINIETSCGADEEVYEDPYLWEDKNHDGIATPDEYVRKLSVPSSCDTNHNGQKDPGETWKWWNDRNGNKKVDNGELLPWDSNNVSFMTPFVKGQLEALEKKDSHFLPNDEYLKGDKNNDGIVTTREWYEYAIKCIYEEFEGDNDGDGLVDEDGGEYDKSTGFNVKIYVDNDKDGFINEDPSPPSSAFWPNEKPNKPNRPEGVTNGKINEIYSYSSETEDFDSDDVFYLFDWGDGTNSGWIGPYGSGQKCTVQHSWSKKGNYQIKVKSRDSLYANSPWSDPLVVSMPRNRAINTPVINFLERYPILYQFFQRVLQL